MCEGRAAEEYCVDPAFRYKRIRRRGKEAEDFFQEPLSLRYGSQRCVRRLNTAPKHRRP